MRISTRHIKQLIAAFIATAVICGMSFARPQNTNTQQTASPKQTPQKEKSIVDYDADVARKLKGDSTIRLIGNVIFHHNGAIIQCDSAYRYDDMRMDCFGNVIINQDSTYIYGDKASYNGNINQATVYAPLIKMISGNAILYTFQLKFNTKTNIGEYSSGGVIIQKDNLMESDMGIYDADRKEVKFLHNVAMRNEDYVIKTDSVSYNLDTEIVTFLTKTDIWDHDRDFLTADRGNYHRSSQTYIFTQNAYALTPDQELWSDTMRYISPLREVFMEGNIQIIDTAQKIIAFGDWGFYNDSTKNAILTRLPSILGYEAKGDTAYMRADSIFMFSYPPGQSKIEDKHQESADMLNERVEEIRNNLDSLAQDSLPRVDSTAVADSIRMLNPEDSLQNPAIDTLISIKEKVEIEEQIVKDSIVIDKEQVKIKEKESTKAQKKRRRKKEKITEQIIDTTTHAPKQATLPDSLPKPKIDSLITHKADSLDKKIVTADSTMLAGTTKDKKEKNDSLERVIKAYHNVRLFRKDIQGICDSTISFSVDSTMNMFGYPILWNEENQLSADQIDVYSKDGEIDWADFIGSPFIIQQVDSTAFNQASGRKLNAFFKSNELESTYMSGNVMNYYYYQDEKGRIEAFTTVTAPDMTMFFKNREPVKLKYEGAYEFAIYPIKKIPADQPTRLEGFNWQPEKRPANKEEIMTRIVRNSYREDAEKIEQPKFTIDDNIQKYRENLLQEGVWSDRNDIPRLTSDYFKNRDL